MLPVAITVIMALVLLCVLVLNKNRQGAGSRQPFDMSRKRSARHLKYHAETASPTHAVPQKHAPSLPGLPIFAMLAALFVAACVLLAVFLYIGDRDTGTDWTPALHSAEETLAMYRAAGSVLADFLNENYAGEQIVLLLPPEPLTQDLDTAVLSSLKAKISTNIEAQVVHMPDTGEEPEMPWYEPEAEEFDQMLLDHLDSAAIVSIAGLPARLAGLEFWQIKKKPDLIVMNAQVLQLKRLIERRYIDAVLIRNPGGTADLPAAAPENWLLVTPQNLDRIIKSFPGLFAE